MMRILGRLYAFAKLLLLAAAIFLWHQILFDLFFEMGAAQ